MDYERLIRTMRRLIPCVGHRSPPARPAPSPLTAHHEAGHAVAAVALGIALDRVSVVGDCDTLGRIVLLEKWPHRRPGFDPHDPEHRRIAEDWIILALVGEYADALRERRHPDRSSPGARWDIEHAEKVAAWLFDQIGERRAFLERMHERARAFVADPLRWRQISVVAVQLSRRLDLEGGQVVSIMDEIAALGDSGSVDDSALR